MPGPFELYLIRHGVAEERGDAWPDDTQRPLTDDGRSKLRKAARGLERLGVSFEVVLTSPLVRARQTAEVIAAAFEHRPPIVSAEALTPGGSHQAVVAELEKQTRRVRIALIGHEPAIGELAARLIGARRPIEFKKGAVCRIDMEDLSGPGALRWFATPKMLRAVQR